MLKDAIQKKVNNQSNTACAWLKPVISQESSEFFFKTTHAFRKQIPCMVERCITRFQGTI